MKSRKANYTQGNYAHETTLEPGDRADEIAEHHKRLREARELANERKRERINRKDEHIAQQWGQYANSSS